MFRFSKNDKTNMYGFHNKKTYRTSLLAKGNKQSSDLAKVTWPICECLGLCEQHSTESQVASSKGKPLILSIIPCLFVSRRVKADVSLI